MIKAVVFDLDHTLFDRYETLKKVAPFLKDNFKLNPNLKDDEVADIMINTDKNFVHKGWKRLQEEIVKTDLFFQELKTNEYHEFVMSKFMDIAVPFDFTIPMLEELKVKNYKLALITNGIPKLQRKKLEMLHIKDYFDYIYVGGEHEVQKPHIKPFLETADNLNLKPCECAYVGDNPINDVDASRKAGYIPIHVQTTGNWILPEIEKPEYSVKTVAEVPKLIEKINQEQ